MLKLCLHVITSIASNKLTTAENATDQLQLIVSLVGQPTRSEIRSLRSKYGESVLASVEPRPGASLADCCSGVDTEALDLMRNLLRFAPHDRFTAEEVRVLRRA